MKNTGTRSVLAAAGIVTGFAAFILALAGNPGNMGFCIACFLRDIAGSLSLHGSETVQYMRPEIIGIILGSFVISLLTGEFSPRSGSSPLLRFLIGMCVSIGALVFLGCPLRMVLRFSAGDANAIAGLAGFILGIAAGCFVLNQGFSLGPARETNRLEGTGISFVAVLFLLLLVLAPSLLKFSTSGPGSMRAPVILSLAMGLVVGAFAQRSRLCFAGGVRDLFLLRDSTLITGFIAVFVSSLVFNIASGSFHFGFENQPIAHTDQLFNLLGMFIVGFGSVLLGGCPLRQLVLAGQGSSDSAVTVLGLIIGGAVAHNFNLASSTAGATAGGKAASVIIIVFLAFISFTVIAAKRRNEK